MGNAREIYWNEILDEIGLENLMDFYTWLFEKYPNQIGCFRCENTGVIEITCPECLGLKSRPLKMYYREWMLNEGERNE